MRAIEFMSDVPSVHVQTVEPIGCSAVFCVDAFADAAFGGVPGVTQKAQRAVEAVDVTATFCLACDFEVAAVVHANRVALKDRFATGRNALPVRRT